MHMQIQLRRLLVGGRCICTQHWHLRLSVEHGPGMSWSRKLMSMNISWCFNACFIVFVGNILKYVILIWRSLWTKLLNWVWVITTQKNWMVKYNDQFYRPIWYPFALKNAVSWASSTSTSASWISSACGPWKRRKSWKLPSGKLT